MTPALPEELSPFLAGREVAERSLLALAAAESLTDPLAHDLLRVALGENGEPEGFVASLHFCDFVVERNSEWHFAPRIREALVEQLTGELELSDGMHTRLLELAEADDGSASVPDELPRYLQVGVGRAYHATFLSDEGVHRYAQLADQPLSGQLWLAGQLASEQVRLGVIPEETIEVMFLQGMILYRERRWREAERLLRKVAMRSEPCHEVAVAAHLVGRMDGRRSRSRKRGESLLRKSLEIGRTLGNRFHTAQALHTLGQLVGRDQKRRAEAEELLRESLEILRTLDNAFGTAQVLHTLGQLIGRDQRRRAEAEELLRASLEIGRDLDRPNHQAQVLYSISQLAGMPPDDAEALLRESLELNRQMHDSHGEQIVDRALRRLRKKQ